MATTGEKIYEWDRHPRMPVPAPPRGSCDCQFHIYDDPAKFPPRLNPPYPAITSATFAEAQRLHKAIGFDRGVIVHSAIYGSDHRLLLHALESLNDRDRYRGIGIVDDRVSDNDSSACMRLVCAARDSISFAFLPSISGKRRSGARWRGFASWAGTRGCT